MAAIVEAAMMARDLAAAGRQFRIINEANNSVLTIHKGIKSDVKAGAEVQVDKIRPDRADLQTWYLDVEGIIRSKINDFAIVGKGLFHRHFDAQLHGYALPVPTNWLIADQNRLPKVNDDTGSSFLDRLTTMWKNYRKSEENAVAVIESGSGDQVHVGPFNGDARHQWIFQGNKIVNRTFCTECLGLKKHLRLKDDADVIASAYEGLPYQHWKIEPV